MTTAMRNPKHTTAALAIASLLLAGCSAAAGSTGPASPSAPHSPESPAAAPPENQPAGGRPDTLSATGSTASGPSKASKMICGQETKEDISSTLALQAAPHTTSNWVDSTYTCTYHLTDGPLVISVKESADPASARTHFDSLQGKLQGAAPIKGLANLGFPAYQTSGGAVVFLKDNTTLSVDATQLPGAVGPSKVTPAAFAYQVSTTILACWKEHH
jgi:hypothetical protein